MNKMALIMDKEDVSSFYATNYTNTPNFSEPESLNVVVPLSGLYTIILVMGILGNIHICIVIGRNRTMHTATNFYIFSVSISDLILLSGLPLKVYRLWYPFSYPLGEALCIAMGFLSESSANAIVLTIVAFTLERYVTVMCPSMSQMMFKPSRVVRSIIAIWIYALCFAIPGVMQIGIVTNEIKHGIVSICTVKEHGAPEVLVLFSFMLFVISMSFTTVLNVLIADKYRALRLIENASVENDELSNGTLLFQRGASQRKVNRMLAAVSLSFFLCWSPFHVQRFIAIYGKNEPNYTLYQVYVVLTSVSEVLYFLSTAIKPFVYIIMSDKFRNAFKITLTSWCGRRNRSRFQRSYSAELEFRRQQSAARAPNRPHSPLLLRRLSTASSQLSDALPRVTILKRSKLTVVNEDSKSWDRRQLLAEGSNSLKSPQSISNSSLCEVDLDENLLDLATHLYQVNCRIKGETRDTSLI